MFHQTLPPQAYHYALPYDFYERFHVRRYGFHGTSHYFVAKEAARHLGQALEETNCITLHLGNGASATAIKNGRSVDTSMGLTPLEGLVMGTRCGDLDPALHFYLLRETGLSPEALERLLLHKTKRVPVLEDIQAHSIGHGQAAPADRANRTGAAGRGAGPVAPRRFGIVQFEQVVFQDVAQGGRQLPAGVDFAVGQDGDKIEGRAAAETGAAPKEGDSLLLMKDIDQVVLDPHNRVFFRRPQVGFQKGGIFLAAGDLQVGPLPHLGEAVEKKAVGLPLKPFGQGDHLVQIVPGQRQHDHGIDVQLLQDLQEFHHPVKVARTANPVVMLPQPFQTDLEEMGFPDGPDFPQPFTGGGVPQDGRAEPQFLRRPVQFIELGMQQGVAAGEADLALNPLLPAESIQVV